jgi:hypothetical protein
MVIALLTLRPYAEFAPNPRRSSIADLRRLLVRLDFTSSGLELRPAMCPKPQASTGNIFPENVSSVQTFKATKSVN